MSQKIAGNVTEYPGNVTKDSVILSRRFRGMLLKIPGNVPDDSRQCSRRFRGMFKKILGSVPEHSREHYQRFWGMFYKIPVNVQKDSGDSYFRFISWNLAQLLSNFAVKLPQNNGKKKQLLSNFSQENIFSTTTYNKSSELNYYFSYLATFFVSFSFLLCWSKRVITLRRNRGIKKL